MRSRQTFFSTFECVIDVIVSRWQLMSIITTVKFNSLIQSCSFTNQRSANIHYLRTFIEKQIGVRLNRALLKHIHLKLKIRPWKYISAFDLEYNTIFIQNKNLSKSQGIQGFLKWRKRRHNAHNAQNALTLKEMGLLCVIVGFIVEQGDREWNPLSGTGAYPCVCCFFFNRKDSVINACNLSDRQRERKFNFVWKGTRKHEQKGERK